VGRDEVVGGSRRHCAVVRCSVRCRRGSSGYRGLLGRAAGRTSDGAVELVEPFDELALPLTVRRAQRKKRLPRWRMEMYLPAESAAGEGRDAIAGLDEAENFAPGSVAQLSSS
jgi:hypothetical protein